MSAYSSAHQTVDETKRRNSPSQTTTTTDMTEDSTVRHDDNLPASPTSRRRRHKLSDCLRNQLSQAARRFTSVFKMKEGGPGSKYTYIHLFFTCKQ